MIVRDLIDLLSRLDLDAPVLVDAGDYCVSNYVDASYVWVDDDAHGVIISYDRG